MFPYQDPQIRLDLHRQHFAELVREAEEYRRARSVGRPAGRWRWAGKRGRPRRVAAAA